MTSREFIEMIRDADPEGDAVMDLGGFITNIMKVPAWYDGKAPIIENKVLKRINTGSKISVVIQTPEEYIYDYIDESDTLINNYNNCIKLLDESIYNRENRIKKYIIEMCGIDSLTTITTTLKYIFNPRILFMPDGYKDSEGKVNSNGLHQFILSNPQFMETYEGFIKFKPIEDKIYKKLEGLKDDVFLFNGMFLTDMVKAYRVHYNNGWKICDFEKEYEFNDFSKNNTQLIIYNPKIHKINNF